MKPERKTRKNLTEAAAALAWGKTLDETAEGLGVERKTLMDWMQREEFREAWKSRYADYVRYLQGACAACLEEQVRGADEKTRSGAAAAILKLGERLAEEDEGGMQVVFAMPPPGEAGGEADAP